MICKNQRFSKSAQFNMPEMGTGRANIGLLLAAVTHDSQRDLSAMVGSIECCG